ncbi:hypothetical protein AAF712_012432 [Marasmius tenuissimus]|uniref:F-box domain-containing protein n=1 Tax=Marasmius tenuissimus TaxID=585030 RepID=A0ABR2ZII9_9AGAR
MEIFSIACEKNELCPPSTPNALKLSSVCGRWWEVIRSAPKLCSSITIRSNSWKGKFLALEKLYLPSLHTPEPNLSYIWVTWESDAVVDFLARSSCSITSLSLQNLPITGDQAITLLELIPTLVSLEIKERPRTEEDLETGPLPNRIITQPFLKRLAVEHEMFRSSHPFLPLLTDIRIALWEDDSIEQGLFNTVASRWIPDPVQAKETGVKSLKSVTITMLGREDDSGDRWWLKALKCFRDVGLRLRVGT